MKGAHLAAVAVILGATSPSFATTKQECAAAYEQTQSLRKEGKLSAARAQALVCAGDDCPGVVRGDCTTWLAGIERSLPTVVLVVRDEQGKEIADVRVIDVKNGEQVLRESLDGKAVPLDPGEHMLRFERAGAAPIEQKVMVHEGDKLTRIEVSFAPSNEAGSSDETSAGGKEDSGALQRSLSYILGGMSIIGLGTAGALGVIGMNELDNFKQTCWPQCRMEDTDATRTKFLIADVLGGVSLATLGVATVLFLTAPSGSKSGKSGGTGAALHFEVGPTRGGAFLGIRGAF